MAAASELDGPVAANLCTIPMLKVLLYFTAPQKFLNMINWR